MAVPSMIEGSRSTDLVGLTTLIKREVYEAIFDIDPYQTPVFQYCFASKRNKTAVGQPKYELQEDVLVPHIAVTTTAVAAQNTTQNLTLTNAGEYKYFKVGDIVRIAGSGENAYVHATASNTISILPLNGSGGTAFTAVAAGGTLIRLGPSFAEGSASAAARSTLTTQPYNYTQILKKSVHMTGTQEATVMYGGSDWTHQRVKATKEMKLDIERMFLFGVRNVTTTAGAYVRSSGGFLDSATTDGMGIQDVSQYVGNDFCEEAYFFNTYLKNLFAKGQNSKILFCGADAMLAIGEFSKVKVQTRPMDKEYGVDIRTIITPFGQARLVWHPMLEGGYGNWVIGIDREDYLKYAYLSGNGKNRDLQWQDNIGTVGTDERKAQYLAEIGCWLAGGVQGIHRVLKPGASS